MNIINTGILACFVFELNVACRFALVASHQNGGVGDGRPDYSLLDIHFVCGLLLGLVLFGVQ